MLWVVLYNEVRGPTEEEFVQPPKVEIYSVLFFYFFSFEQISVTLTLNQKERYLLSHI